MRKTALLVIPLLGLFAIGCPKAGPEEKPTTVTGTRSEKAAPAKAAATAAPPPGAITASPAPSAAGRTASAQPLLISRIESAWLSQTRSPDGNGVCWAFYRAERIDDDNYRWGSIFDSDSAWLRHTDVESAPVALLIYKNSHPVDVRAGDYVTVRYDGGKTVRIYPPALSGVNGTFYVSSQGETYLDRELTRPARAAPASE